MKEHFQEAGCRFRLEPGAGQSRPCLYRWDQWLFLELFDRGLAYKATAPVNWCPKDQTVLANEQVVDGACERCGLSSRAKPSSMVLQDHRVRRPAARRPRRLDDWPDRVRTMQRNWIGRSEGARFRIPIKEMDASFEGVHHPARHHFRNDLLCARPRAPTCRGADLGLRPRKRPRSTSSGCARRRSSVSPRVRRRVSSPAGSPSTRSTEEKFPSSSPTTC